MKPVCGELLIFETNQQFATHRRTPRAEKLACRYCGSGDLAPSFIKRGDRRCRKCFGKRYGSAAQANKARIKKQQPYRAMRHRVHLEIPTSIGRLSGLLSGQLLRAAEPAGPADCTELIDRGLKQRTRAFAVAIRAATQMHIRFVEVRDRAERPCALLVEHRARLVEPLAPFLIAPLQRA
jgi:hypothetical protein